MTKKMFIKIKKGTYYVEPNDPPGIYNLNKRHKKMKERLIFGTQEAKANYTWTASPCSSITICAKFPLFNIKKAECALL